MLQSLPIDCADAHVWEYYYFEAHDYALAALLNEVADDIADFGKRFDAHWLARATVNPD